MRQLILAVVIASSTTFAAATVTTVSKTLIGYVSKTTGVIRIKSTSPTLTTNARYCYLDGNLNPTSTCFTTAADCLQKANMCAVVTD